jgi:phosphate transport system permease protein
MSSPLLLFLILGLMGVGYYSGRRRSLALANVGGTRLHSLPAYYGFYAALWAGLPAVALLALWLFFQDSIITRLVITQLPAELNQLSPDQLNLLLNDIRNIATGNIVSGEITAAMQAAADHYIHLQKWRETFCGR